MAVDFGVERTFIPRINHTSGVAAGTQEQQYLHIFSPGALYPLVVQKVWDTVAGDWHQWTTSGQDVAGAQYDGPGVYGVDTSNYRVVMTTYQES